MPQMRTIAEKAAYLAAFIDGEGHIGLSRIKKTGYYTREISFNNTDKLLFDAVCQICRDLGFPVAVYFYARQLPEHDQWKARISGGKTVYERFLALIPIQSPRKLATIRDLIASYEDADALTQRRRKGSEIECANCRKLFYAPPSQCARFCSRSCHDAHRHRVVTKICETCDISFEVRQAFKQQRFCSRSCAGKAQADRLSALGKKTIAGARYARMRRSITTVSDPKNY